MSTTEDKGIPVPKTVKELATWIQRLNNAHARINELNDARAAAHAALDASFAVALGPHEAHAELLFDGIREYVLEHLKSLKQRHGRTIAFGPSVLKFTVAGKSVTVTSEAELTNALLQNGFEQHIRYEPRVNRTSLKSAKRNDKLRKVIHDAGAYVARHETGTLTLPALAKPVELFKTRYPFVARNEPAE